MILKILIATGILLLVLAILINQRPDDFRVSRSIRIAASAESIFPHVNNLHLWSTWSPWAKLDPQVKESFAGPDAGKGAIFNWSGNREVGEGRMTIIESLPYEHIGIRLDFVRPFVGTNDVKFSFQPEADQTLVTWTMTGHNNFMSKAVGLFMNCEKMCGDMFDQGLSQLKSTVESKPKL
jgi:hypothetical protein